MRELPKFSYTAGRLDSLLVQASYKHEKDGDGNTPVPLEAIASNLEARLAMAPNFSDPSFVQKNYRMPAPPMNEAARQDFVEKLHIPRSHQKSDEVTRLLAELLEVLNHCAKQSSWLGANTFNMSCHCKLCLSVQTTHTPRDLQQHVCAERQDT